MKIALIAVPAALILTTAAVVLPITARAASGHDFDSVISAIEQRYSVHAERVPMMGFVSFCAWTASGGGVKGMKVAEFEHLTAPPDSADLERVVTQALGPDWQPFVKERQRNGELNLIFVQPNGPAVRMLIAAYDNDELNLVRMELNGERLAHWVREPESSAHRHDYGTGEKQGNPD